MNRKLLATLFAVSAAVLYAINVPLSKSMLDHISPAMMTALLYLGAGIGLLLVGMVGKTMGKVADAGSLTRNEVPYLVAMVSLDVIGSILLMYGISMTTSANTSLLNNFEIVVTSIIAMLIFKEAISRKMWLAIVLVTLASMILTFEGQGSLVFNTGSLLVLGACICWGAENNCTRVISDKSTVEITTIKGLFTGLGGLAMAFVLGESMTSIEWIPFALLLGFVTYGMSINFYILAQRDLGAARTSAFYAIVPFLGVVFSMILLGERPDMQFFVALLMMILGAYVMVKDVLVVSQEEASRENQ